MIIALSRDKFSITGLFYEKKYVPFLKSFGASILKIPNRPEEVESYFNQDIKAIVLIGGNDINPKKYGDDVQWPNISDKRDQTETILLDIAIKKKIPVLGICRGMQFINVYFGGKLVRNISDHPFKSDHSIRITEHRIEEYLGKACFNVNSHHHQLVTKEVKAKSLNIFAETDSGVVEGLFHPFLPIAGIQWHPERKSPDNQINRRIVEAFLSGEMFWER